RAAEAVRLLDDQRGQPTRVRGQCGGESTGPRADDQDIDLIIEAHASPPSSECSTSSRTTSSGCSSCGQWPAPATTAERPFGIRAATPAAQPGGLSLSCSPSITRVGT